MLTRWQTFIESVEKVPDTLTYIIKGVTERGATIEINKEVIEVEEDIRSCQQYNLLVSSYLKGNISMPYIGKKRETRQDDG